MSTSEPIRLGELRQRAEQGYDSAIEWDAISPDELLALIEAVEAADRRAREDQSCPICKHVGISVWNGTRWAEEARHFSGCPLANFTFAPQPREENR